MADSPVSVVITVYERQSFLPDAIESVLAQTHDGLIEIVVVDDGASTPARSVFGNRFPQVRWLRQVNLGVCAARHQGAMKASHDLIAFLDDDDVWLPTKLEVQVRFLESHPEVEFVCCDLCGWGESTPERGYFGRRLPTGIGTRESIGAKLTAWTYARDALIDAFFEVGPFYTSTLLARRSALERIGGWNPLVRGVGDGHDLLLRANHEGTIAFIETPLTRLRRGHGDHMTADLIPALIQEGLEILRFERGYPPDLRRRLRPALPQYLARSANRCLRQGHIVKALSMYARAARAGRGPSVQQLRALLAPAWRSLIQRWRAARRPGKP